MTFDSSEETRICKVYTERDEISPWDDRLRNIYHPRNPTGELFYEHNRHILITALNTLKIELPGMKVLDVGCGYGNWLRNFVDFGADAKKCYGIDISPLRIEIARQKNNSINYHQQSIASLPFQNNEFDLVIQSVVFSSIRESESRKICALEMVRVLKNTGWLFWLDIQRTKSPELHPFDTEEVCGLFPDLSLVYKKPVHPSYFRKINGRFAPFSRFFSELINWNCESAFLIFRK
jgi:ubiquinone/menaquinone biosynthesis C-methylase UbiE